jgi:hypothetical protein
VSTIIKQYLVNEEKWPYDQIRINSNRKIKYNHEYEYTLSVTILRPKQ